MKAIWTVFNKEVGDNLRDKRSITNIIIAALIGPVMILVMMYLLGQLLNQDPLTKALKLPVKGAENAPNLVEYLEQNNVIIMPAPQDPEAAVRNGDLDIVLIIDPEYGKTFKEGRPAPIQVVVDSSRQSSLPSVEQTRNLLDSYAAQIGAMRLLVRGINPALTHPLLIERKDVATPQSQVFIFLNMLPYFLILTIFTGGSAAIIDATAGERERGSLEPLLINPVPRWQLVVGKMLASLPFVLAAILLSLSALAIIFNVVPTDQLTGIRLSVDLAALVNIFLVCLPMLVLAAAIQTIMASFARSFKEAQTLVGWLPLIPALPGIGLAFLPIKPSIGVMLIPTFGQQLLINQFLRGEPVDPLNLLISSAATLLVSGLLVYVAVRLYSREQIVFGKQS
jgi:sodium transport system permease protein